MFHRPIPFDDAIKAPIAAAHRQAHLRITDQLMTIGLPQGVRLHLGDDLSAEFPPALRQIANPNLITLLAQIDPTLDSTRDSGAIDWAELPIAFTSSPICSAAMPTLPTSSSHRSRRSKSHA